MLLYGIAAAQHTAADQASVWAVVELQRNSVADGDVEMNNGRDSDMRVRTDDGWNSLSWHGGSND